MLIEDERGSVNLIVPPRVYDRHRRTVRASPLVRASGKLERREGTINVVVREIAELERPAAPERPPAPTAAAPVEPPRRREAPPPLPAPPDISRPERREPPPAAPSRRDRELVIAELREVAPAGHNFGRRG
jgi:hypothetical protein